MPSDPNAERRFDRAEAMLAEYLSRIEGGDAVSIDAWCAEQPEIASELRRLHAEYLELQLALEAPNPTAEGAASAKVLASSSELLARLRSPRTAESSYTKEDVIGRGGMGEVLAVRDEVLRRELAMKVIRKRGDRGVASDAQRLARFLQEAQVMAQLDHPGVVPVHELGLDGHGQPYFTMKRVRGQTLAEVFGLIRDGKEGWTVTRGLSLLQRVCDAMSYAHEQGVIHRDLKPSNVMVGKFGEVYVMDWGLARIRGGLELSEAPESPPRALESDRSAGRRGKPDSAVYTRTGHAVGTLQYMPPEQAQGRWSDVDARSDVYAVGAMLYHLLAGHAPYVESGEPAAADELQQRVLAGPPRRLDEVAPRAPPELAAICTRAMQRDPTRRYSDMRALSADLGAFVEQRVVSAYATGAWAEARKWVQRNRWLSGAFATAVLAVVGGAFAFAVKAREAERLRASAELTTTEVLSLTAAAELDELGSRAARLWPATPSTIVEYESWLQRAEAVINGGLCPFKPSATWPSLTSLKSRLQALDFHDSSIREDVDDPDRRSDLLWRDVLSQLIKSIEAFSDPLHGIMSDTVAEPFGWGVRRRYEFARTIRARSIDGPDAAERWRTAIAAIATSPEYTGLNIVPQLGLLPIGEDPHSRLWEFAHLQTGTAAKPGADERLEISEETGLVFVLLPAGEFVMGAQRLDPDGPNFDEFAEDVEGPPTRIRLDAFFLSKYEMTQAQWLRMTGANPSVYKPGYYPEGWAGDLRHPVERLSWDECAQLLVRMELTLPSEAQWEYGARGGTVTRWWTGHERESLSGAINLADGTALAAGAPWPECNDWPELEDGFLFHAPVGSYRANHFGLHDVAGNVREWCQDWLDSYQQPAREGDGYRESLLRHGRVHRGGDFTDTARAARSTLRFRDEPSTTAMQIGVRPARPIVP